MTRLDKNHKESLSSKLISTAKDMPEGQELTIVPDDNGGLPMRCIIHGELTDSYNSLVYASNPRFIDHYFYVPNYDGSARIDELHISLQCENS